MNSELLLLSILAFIVSFFTSQAGVSGAFLLLPIQISVLGITSPVASSTNLAYNIIAIPSGIYRYRKEGKFLMPLAFAVLLGSIPGILIGSLVRVYVMLDPKDFKLFVGFVLLYLGLRLLFMKSKKFERAYDRISIDKQTLLRVEYSFCNERFSFSIPKVFLLSFVVGIVGGAYGIGGGALIAPILVSAFRLPAYTIAGATLTSTFASSILGVISYSLLGYQPNWKIAFLFGIGGLAGMYLGARFQKYMPEKVIRLILVAVTLSLALRYILQFLDG